MERDYKINSVEVCRKCGGDGFIQTGDNTECICPVCGGTGLVEVCKELLMTIKPKIPRIYGKNNT